jgi:hypothetical protein
VQYDGTKILDTYKKKLCVERTLVHHMMYGLVAIDEGAK